MLIEISAGQIRKGDVLEGSIVKKVTNDGDLIIVVTYEDTHKFFPAETVEVERN